MGHTRTHAPEGLSRALLIRGAHYLAHIWGTTPKTGPDSGSHLAVGQQHVPKWHLGKD